MKPKIYIFVNNRTADDVVGAALSEDGMFLAGHLSSNESYLHHDMGLSSSWKHEAYAKHYPDGYELEWVANPKEHAGTMAAYEKHLQLEGEASR